MPRMDGMELVRRIRERTSSCGIIFLSGYSDKENLKAAIRLNAADFIEKPIRIEEISEAVGRNVRTMRERADSATETERARKALSSLEPLVRQSLAADLLHPGASEESLRRKYEPRIVDPFLPGPARAAVIDLPNAAVGDRQRQISMKEPLRFVNETPALAGLFAACATGADRVGLVAGRALAADPVRFDRELLAIASELAGAWEDLQPLRVGIGPPVAALAALSDSYAKAEVALGQRFYRPDERLLYHAPVKGGAFVLEEASLSELRTAFEQCDLDRSVALLRAVEARAREVGAPDVGSVREAYLTIAALMLEAAPGWNPGEVRVERESIRREVEALDSLRGLSTFAEFYLNKSFAPGRNRPAADRRIGLVTDFVRAHYADPNLTVNTVAVAAGLSESYLCTFYKQACGVTVKDFVTQVRIEKAKDLLRQNFDKLQVVALSVGFRDANYFSTVFKRQVGITPGEYRDRSR